MAADGGNGPLAPHMRPFVLHQCVRLVEDNPPSKWMHFLLGLGGYPSRHGNGYGKGNGDGDGDGDSDGNDDGDGDGDGDGDDDGDGDGNSDNNNNQSTIS